MKKLISFLIISCTLLFAQEIGAKYLIITHDNFYDAIQPLAQWKHKKGIKTKVVKLSETGSSASAIRDYIMDAYNNWQIPPEYLLLVGAPNYLAFPEIGWVYTDNYYTNMDGDIYNEILSGRLTVHNTTEAENAVNKILLYEKAPYMDDSLWFVNACLIVREDYDPPDDSIYWSDIYHARDLMLQTGYDTIDTLSLIAGDDKWDVIDCVDDGRAFVLFRGQGLNNWWSPFDVNPDLTHNGPKLPVVLSITCSTIGSGSSPAVAEKWFLTGSPSTPRGGSGYFATTTVVMSGAYLRSAICKGFFDAVFTDKKRTFGEACEAGRKAVYDQYFNADEYRGFMTIGDPEMNIWTATPKPVEVSHEPNLYIDDDSLNVQVTLNAVPFESALVCIVLDTLIYQYDYTSDLGEITFYFDTLCPGVMDITVTGRNIIPYEGTINVQSNAPFLVYQSYEIDDTLANNNGIPESGETILLGTLIKNEGLVTANNVVTILQSSDPLIYMIDSLVSFGDIPPQDSSFGLSKFVLSISPFCPGGHIVDFVLTMKDSLGNIWNSSLSVTVRTLNGATGPDEYGYYIYDDTDTLTGNAPVFDWFEIAPPGPGMIVSEITNEDADTVTYSLPFNFKYYGIDYNSVGMCSNGFLEMAYSTYRFGDNGPIPNLGGPKRLLAPFWDDLDPSLYGDIYFYDDYGNHRYIIEFKDCAHYDNSSLRETFQIVLYDPQYYITPTGDGDIMYLYESVADVSSNTIGIEDHEESRGIQYLYENNYDPDAAPITSQRVLLITTEPPVGYTNTPWLYTLNYTIDDSISGNNNGIIEPDETIDIYINVKNDGDTMAFDVQGILRCEDPDAQILDSVANYGDIAIGAVGNNLDDTYKVYLLPDPSDSTIAFVLYWSCNDGSYEKQDYFTIYLYEPTGTMEQHKLDITNSLIFNVYPNPSRDKTNIMFSIGQIAERIEIKIYEVTGRLVKSFALPTTYSLGPTVLSWDGSDDMGRKVPQGIYFVSFVVHPGSKAENYNSTEKIIFLR